MPSKFEIAVIILLLVNLGLSIYMKMVRSQENFQEDQQDLDEEVHVQQVASKIRTTPPITIPPRYTISPPNSSRVIA
jgi:hypothetical protein